MYVSLDKVEKFRYVGRTEKELARGRRNSKVLEVGKVYEAENMYIQDIIGYKMIFIHFKTDEKGIKHVGWFKLDKQFEHIEE